MAQIRTPSGGASTPALSSRTMESIPPDSAMPSVIPEPECGCSAAASARCTAFATGEGSGPGSAPAKDGGALRFTTRPSWATAKQSAGAQFLVLAIGEDFVLA